mmetsp:Transcript_50573/g.84052  ORF Transcript_50573/g.84052 Transcript_50573/m.84052 type:complete len:178 (-) Transcript_50573:31-564(-)
MGAAVDTMMDVPSNDPITGALAMGAAKVARAVSYEAAGYDEMLAAHAVRTAKQIEESRRTLEHYIFGTDVITIIDREPTAGLVEHHVPDYSAYPYPQGWDHWPEEGYPAPEPPHAPPVDKTPPVMSLMPRELAALLPPPALHGNPELRQQHRRSRTPPWRCRRRRDAASTKNGDAFL